MHSHPLLHCVFLTAIPTQPEKDLKQLEMSDKKMYHGSNLKLYTTLINFPRAGKYL